MHNLEWNGSVNLVKIWIYDFWIQSRVNGVKPEDQVSVPGLRSEASDLATGSNAVIRSALTCLG